MYHSTSNYTHKISQPIYCSLPAKINIVQPWAMPTLCSLNLRESVIGWPRPSFKVWKQYSDICFSTLLWGIKWSMICKWYDSGALEHADISYVSLFGFMGAWLHNTGKWYITCVRVSYRLVYIFQNDLIEFREIWAHPFSSIRGVFDFLWLIC